MTDFAIWRTNGHADTSSQWELVLTTNTAHAKDLWAVEVKTIYEVEDLAQIKKTRLRIIVIFRQYITF